MWLFETWELAGGQWKNSILQTCKTDRKLKIKVNRKGKQYTAIRFLKRIYQKAKN